MKSETIGWNAVAVAESATGCPGAGGYMAYAEQQGYEFVEVVDWCSSAGDWTFIVSKDGHEWVVMYQENNYPRPGFTRVIAEREVYCGSAIEALAQVIEELYNW